MHHRLSDQSEERTPFSVVQRFRLRAVLMEEEQEGRREGTKAAQLMETGYKEEAADSLLPFRGMLESQKSQLQAVTKTKTQLFSFTLKTIP